MEELRPVLLRHETCTQFVRTYAPDLMLLVLGIEVRIGDLVEQVQMAFPVSMLEPLLLKLEPDTENGKKGAPAGWYKVLVSAFANKIEEGPVTPRYILEAKYYSPEKTDLSVEVVADPAPGRYDLKVNKGAGGARPGRAPGRRAAG